MKFFHLGCLVLFLSPAAAFGQTVGTVDACQNLRNEITAATEASGALNTLMQTEGDEEKYLNDLYEGVKSLSATGEMFFKASDSHENCPTLFYCMFLRYAKISRAIGAAVEPPPWPSSISSTTTHSA